MNLNKLITQFNIGINWNAGSYIFYKSTSTFITFLLYKSLTTYDFTLWAISNSTIYIILLWADCGFRKSLPRYCPIFAYNNHANARFLKFVTRFYMSLLTIVSIFIVIGIYITGHTYIAQQSILSSILYRIPVIFFLEGMNTLFRLLFHAYFFIRQFNLLATIFLSIQLMLDCFMIYTQATSADLLVWLFINKIIIGSSMLVTSISLFYYLKPYHEVAKSKQHTIDFKKTMQNFMRHTCMMWINTLLKSLSERNSLVPVIAFLGGVESAAIFKISNEGALLFQRMVLKTIGTTDTSLLAHIAAEESYAKSSKRMQVAFTKLAQKMATLCLPLIGVILYIGISYMYMSKTTMVFQLFITLTLCYLFEILLQPYERILEVRQSYTLLLIAYFPYALCILYVAFYLSKTWIGLLSFVGLVQCVRLVSMFIMVVSARYIYGVQYPIRYVLIFFGYVLATSIGLSVMGSVLGIHIYVYDLYRYFIL